MDLRERVVAAGDHGDATRQQIAEGFIRRRDRGAIAGLEETSRIVSRARRKTKGLRRASLPLRSIHWSIRTTARTVTPAPYFSSKALLCGGKIGERGAHVRGARPVTAGPQSSVPL
jgi:hypothetical protein